MASRKKNNNVIPLDSHPVRQMESLLEEGLALEEAEYGPREKRRPRDLVPSVLSDGVPKTAAQIAREVFKKHKVHLEPFDLMLFLKAHCEKTGEGPTATFSAKKPK